MRDAGTLSTRLHILLRYCGLVLLILLPQKHVLHHTRYMRNAPATQYWAPMTQAPLTTQQNPLVSTMGS